MPLTGLDDLSGIPPQAAPYAVGKGQDFTLAFRILAGDGRGRPIKVTLAADFAAGVTSLTIKPGHPALASGDKLLFGEDVVITLSGACAAGVATLAVDATLCALRTGDTLVKLQDLTSYTIALEVLTRRGDATPYMADTSFTVTLATQTGVDRGKVTLAALAAATASLTAGSYYAALWRRNSGNVRPLAEFTLKLVEAGFL